MKTELEIASACVAIDLNSGKPIGLPFFSAFVSSVLLIGALRCQANLSPSSLAWYKALVAKSGSVETGWWFFSDQRGYPPDADTTSVVATGKALIEDLSNRDAVSLLELLEANKKSHDSHFVWLETDGVRKNESSDPIVDLNVSTARQLITAQSLPSHDRSRSPFATRTFQSVFYRNKLFADYIKRNARWALFGENDNNEDWKQSFGTMFQHSQRPIGYCLARELRGEYD